MEKSFKEIMLELETEKPLPEYTKEYINFWNGRWSMKSQYKEILRIKEMLDKANIPYEFQTIFYGGHIFYPRHGKKCVCSVIEHDGSYGHEEDRLEILGLMTDEEKAREEDDVLGYLTAEDVFGRISRHFRSAGCRP